MYDAAEYSAIPVVVHDLWACLWVGVLYRGAPEFLCSFHERISRRRGPIGDRAVQHIRPRRLACICFGSTQHARQDAVRETQTEDGTANRETGKGQRDRHTPCGATT